MDFALDGGDVGYILRYKCIKIGNGAAPTAVGITTVLAIVSVI